MGTVFSLPIAYWSMREGWLTRSGALWAVGVGACCFTGGFALALALLLFFFTSITLGLRARVHTQESPLVLEQYGPRDGMQVAAVGAVPALTAIFAAATGNLLFVWMTLGALAFAAADTWATSVGMTAPKPPRLFGWGAPLPPGLSGGMTLRGTVGAAAGALLIGLFGAFAYRPDTLVPVFLVAGTGFLGSILDSVLGGTVQARYRCEDCGHDTEQVVHCDKPAARLRGSWTNWGVNLVSSAVAAGLVWLLWA